MIDLFIGFLPGKLILICTIIAFVVPYSVYKINEKLHEDGDPAWKKADREAEQKSTHVSWQKANCESDYHMKTIILQT